MGPGRGRRSAHGKADLIGEVMRLDKDAEVRELPS